MKWEKIKQKAIREFCMTYTRDSTGTLAMRTGIFASMIFDRIKSYKGKAKGTGIKSEDYVKKFEDTGVQIIDSWDIRVWKDLYAIFPEAFPKWINQASIEYGENGFEFVKPVSIEE
jgi:hypothetical protein